MDYRTDYRMLRMKGEKESLDTRWKMCISIYAVTAGSEEIRIINSIDWCWSDSWAAMHDAAAH